MSAERVAVVFTKDELWLLHAFVRHEVSPPWQGKWPWYSEELNDAIGDALILCEDEGQADAALILSRGDCLLLDAVIPQDAKSPGGVPLGKAVVLKALRARQQIAGGLTASAQEPPAISDREIAARLEARDAHANPDDDARPLP